MLNARQLATLEAAYVGGLSHQRTAIAVGISQSSVGYHFDKFRQAGLKRPPRIERQRPHGALLYTGPSWIGAAISPTPVPLGPAWIGKRMTLP